MATIEPFSVKRTTKRVGILAGSGRLPPLLAEAMLSSGKTPFVVNLTNESPPWLHLLEHRNVPVTQISKLVRELRKANVTEITLAGGIEARPKFADFLPDWRMYGQFIRIFPALQRGDNGLLSVAVGLMERMGFTVVGAHQVAPSLLATETLLTKRQPTATDLQDIGLAIAEAIEHGRLDLGQAVVVRSGRVAAKEGRAGTAAMLTNLKCEDSHTDSGVLVKWSKPNQELRVDLPTIGPDTVTQAKKAGLAGIVIEADRALILDREELVRLADANNLFVAGMRTKP